MLLRGGGRRIWWPHRRGDARTAGQPDSRTAGQPDSRTAGQPDSRTAGQPVIGSRHLPHTWMPDLVARFFLPNFLLSLSIKRAYRECGVAANIGASRLKSPFAAI